MRTKSQVKTILLGIISRVWFDYPVIKDEASYSRDEELRGLVMSGMRGPRLIDDRPKDLSDG